MENRQNIVPKAALAITVGFFFYAWLTVPNNTEGSPVAVFGWAGAAFLYAAILATFATMFVAARRAYHAGSWPWVLVVILFWPLSYVYALAVNRGEQRA